MRKHLLSIFTLLLFAVAIPAMGEGIHVGYTDGKIANDAEGTVTGITGTDATIQEAVFITPAMLKAYASCQITAVNAGLAPTSSSFPEQITVWVRAEKDGEDLASGTGSAQGGWNAVQLDNAINISEYAETGVWVGFTFTQPKKMNVIAFLLSAAADNTGWICKNGKWTDYSKKGALPIEAIVEGEGLPQHDLAIISAKLQPEIIKIGDAVNVKATLKNNALVPAVNPVINYDILDGRVKGSYTVAATLNYRDVKEVVFEIAADGINEEVQGKITLEAAWADGTADEVPDDNVASRDITFAKDVFYKKMLVEEATGAWCGFCVRGIVGLREMTEKYPDTFIGIAVHNGDDYVVKAYDSWIGGFIDGYPSCLVNREYVADPGFKELEDCLSKMDVVATMEVKPSGKVEDGKLVLSTDLQFAKSEVADKYNITYVIVEDQLPINQSNYYAGGGYGPMGGFEDMPGHCDIIVDDIARGVYPSPNGEAVGLAAVAKGETYNHTLTAELPTYANEANTFVVAFVTDTTTGEIVNAGKGKIENLPSGIESFGFSVSSGESLYNVAGQKVNSDYKGIVIKNGKKIIK